MGMNKFPLLIFTLLLFEGCSTPICPEPINPLFATCTNGVKDERETGIDCGGVCGNACNVKTVSIQPGSEGIDVYISTRNKNANASTYPNVMEAWTNQGSPFTSMVLLAFTYDALPKTATIKSAYLTLYADTISNIHPTVSTPKGHSQLSYSNEWYLKKITSPWSESSVTWNNQPQVSNASNMELAASTSRDQAYKIDVTAFVIDEYTSGNYYGFRLEVKNKIPYNAIAFFSSDGPYPALRPKLIIEYY